MSISRDLIISTLRERLEPNPRVLACWLEGADAVRAVDEYSDIDFCCSVEAVALDDAAALAQSALESLGRLDLIDLSARAEDFLSVYFHLEGTPPYLIIDFNAYVGRGSDFIEGDEIEKPLVLFDRGRVVRFHSQAEHLTGRTGEERMHKLSNTVAQYARLEKYVKRGNFLEAFGYYHKWLLLPLIEALRIRYTPLHPDYYIVHISRHLPGDVLRRLEDLFKVNSTAEIGVKSQAARAFFEETAAFLADRSNKI